MASQPRLARPALDRYANDERNPYLYQVTSPQFPRLITRLHERGEESLGCREIESVAHTLALEHKLQNRGRVFRHRKVYRKVS